MYSKRNEDIIDLDNGEDLLPNHLKDRYFRPYPLDFDPELTVEQTGFQSSTFALFLEENVWDFFNSPTAIGADEWLELDSLAEMLDTFSLSDIVANTRDFEARDKMTVYEKSLPARAVAFYGYEYARYVR